MGTACVLAAASLLPVLAGCTAPAPSGSETQEVCAASVSISRVDVKITAAPAGSTIYMNVDVFFPDDAMEYHYDPVPGPLVVGATYTLPPGFQDGGFVDLGRCLDVVASPGVRFQVLAFPVVDPLVMLLYAAGGGRRPGGGSEVFGHLPTRTSAPVVSGPMAPPG